MPLLSEHRVCAMYTLIRNFIDRPIVSRLGSSRHAVINVAATSLCM